ncbi:MAG: hypothetical protein Q7W51_04935 [Coriobacteriia bacterium]|nr:hypothetical protein [Coriobacteriia bacterium]
MTEFVNVPVPADRVQDVYEFLAKTKRAAFNNPDWDEEQAKSYARPPYQWDEELVGRMVQESSEKMRSILRSLAADGVGRDPQSVDDIAKLTGLERAQVVATLGPFDKRVKGRYGMKVMPFDSVSDAEDGRRYLTMPEDVAQMVWAKLEELESKKAR